MRMLREAADWSLANPTADTMPGGQRSLASLVPEFQQLTDSRFRFREPADPSDTVQTVALALLNVSPSEIYAFEERLTEPDLPVSYFWHFSV